MATNWFSLILATVLALSVVSLEAKSLENRYRHMRDISSENSGGESSRTSLNLKYHVPRRENQKERRRRGFAQWNAPHEHYTRLSSWQPSAYTINTTTIGTAGHAPIQIPLRQFNSSVAFLPDNPKLNISSKYLSSKHTNQKIQRTTSTDLSNRSDDLDDDGLQKLVWGISGQTSRPRVNRSQQSAAEPGQGITKIQQTTIFPTRPPRSTSITETPLLRHKINGKKIPFNPTDKVSTDNMSAAEDPSRRPQHYISVFEQPNPIEGTSSVLKTTRIRSRRSTVPTNTTTRAENTVPSNCAWAILSCCSAGSSTVAEVCFAQKGCPGPFWGHSPCDSDFTKAAINKVLEYYGQPSK